MNDGVGLYWFTHDLRLADNALLQIASQRTDTLVCWFSRPRVARSGAQATVLSPAPAPLSYHRWRFLKESLQDLDRSLRKKGNYLHVEEADDHQRLLQVLDYGKITVIYQSKNAGWWEQHQLRTIQRLRPKIRVIQAFTHTLFTPNELPFCQQDLPATFSKFRKIIEAVPIQAPTACVETLPPPALAESLLNESRPLDLRAIDLRSKESAPNNKTPDLDNAAHCIQNPWKGGETAGKKHLVEYFSTSAASTYKMTRNALDGERNSTKFSFWLANGSLSPKSIVDALKAFEQREGANESTDWILFELYWREYFQWYAHKYGSLLFHVEGIHSRKPLTSFYAERFARWRHGTTPYPIVNACMHQLNDTGYMSNRGRQLVASCFVNELALDWRYGARYFEQQLIDYDVAANWGNWQYLAGVGADPRGCRRFDLRKQTDRYDPNKQFIQTWQGDAPNPQQGLHSVDAADWPLIHSP